MGTREQPMNKESDRTEFAADREPDRALKDDIRLLGRILGDTVRDQQGQDIFDLVELIRQTSVRFHRDGDEAARRKLESILQSLTPSQSVQIVRAYSYFSHLSNIAEDQNQIRKLRRDAVANLPPPPGTLARALSRAHEADMFRGAIAGLFRPRLHGPGSHRASDGSKAQEHDDAGDGDRTSPRTARPPGMDAGRRNRDRGQDPSRRSHPVADEPAAPHQAQCSRRSLERARLLRLYLLKEVPQLYQQVERQVRAYDPSLDDVPIASFLRLGSWIGGDRDGNPYVDAEVLRTTTQMHGARILTHYLDELGKLGSELSLTGELVEVTDELRELASSSPDSSPHRMAEPYRRAIAAIRGRIAANLRAIDDQYPIRSRGDFMPAYRNADEFRRDLHIIDQSLKLHGSRLITRGRLRALRRAASCFGFHLATVDLRQNSDVHERTIAELLEAVAPGTDYLSRNEDERVALLIKELNEVRPLISPFLGYSDETRKELAIFHAAVEARATYGSEVIRTSIISKAESVSRHARARGHPQRGRPDHARQQEQDRHRAFVRDDRRLCAIAPR